MKNGKRSASKATNRGGYEVNLGAESIYLLTMGILEMFRRIFSTHGLENG